MGNLLNCYTCSKEEKSLELASLENTPEFCLNGMKCNCKVLDIYDGDTITLAFIFHNNIYKKRCRIEGVDCAEIKSKNKEEKEIANKCKKFLTELVLNKLVFVEFSSKNDKYGRLLAKIYLLNGESLTDILINSNFGYAYNGKTKLDFEDWHNKNFIE